MADSNFENVKIFCIRKGAGVSIYFDLLSHRGKAWTSPFGYHAHGSTETSMSPLQACLKVVQ
jgi:hypothetical protein